MHHGEGRTRLGTIVRITPERQREKAACGRLLKDRDRRGQLLEYR